MSRRLVSALDLKDAAELIASYEARHAAGAVWPDVVIVPIPNLPEHAGRLLEALAVEGLLLTGGNDLGTEPDRDRTESDCLAYAARHGLPVIGVCRGFQMMVAAEGGQVIRTDPGVHVATRHPVRCLSDTDWGWTGGGRALCEASG